MHVVLSVAYSSQLFIALLGILAPSRQCLRLQHLATPARRSAFAQSTADEWQPLYDVHEYQELTLRKRFSRTVFKGTPSTICINGKSMPVFYLLGGQKAASTSVAATLAQSGIVWKGPKELHAFGQGQRSEYYSFPGLPSPGRLLSKRLQASVDTWTKWSDWRGQVFPACGQEHGAVADMSPNYLSAPNITDVLSHFYGERAGNLTFMILLREPLERLHSAYHFLRRRNNAGEYPKLHGFEYVQNFAEFLKLSQLKFHAGGHADGIENSLYGKGLRRFLDAGFSAAQFVIVPVKAYNQHAEAVVKAVAERLGMSQSNASMLPPNHANANDHHLSLEEDLAKVTKVGKGKFLNEIQKVFKDDLQTLVRQLASGQAKGMSLVGFDGEIGKHEDIEQWLLENW